MLICSTPCTLTKQTYPWLKCTCTMKCSVQPKMLLKSSCTQLQHKSVKQINRTGWAAMHGRDDFKGSQMNLWKGHKVLSVTLLIQSLFVSQPSLRMRWGKMWHQLFLLLLLREAVQRKKDGWMAEEVKDVFCCLWLQMWGTSRSKAVGVALSVLT